MSDLQSLNDYIWWKKEQNTIIISAILMVIIIRKGLMISSKRYIKASCQLLMQTRAFTHPRISLIAGTQHSLATVPFLAFRFRH